MAVLLATQFLFQPTSLVCTLDQGIDHLLNKRPSSATFVL